MLRSVEKRLCHKSLTNMTTVDIREDASFVCVHKHVCIICTCKKGESLLPVAAAENVLLNVYRVGRKKREEESMAGAKRGEIVGMERRELKKKACFSSITPLSPSLQPTHVHIQHIDLSLSLSRYKPPGEVLCLLVSGAAAGLLHTRSARASNGVTLAL